MKLKLKLSAIRCLDLVRKCHKKKIYFAKHLKHIWVGSGSGSGSGRIWPFLGHPDPDPYLKNQIWGSGSEKKLTGSATLLNRGRGREGEVTLLIEMNPLPGRPLNLLMPRTFFFDRSLWYLKRVLHMAWNNTKYIFFSSSEA